MNEHLSRPVLDADEAAALEALGWRGDACDSNCPDSSLLLAAEDGVLDEDVASRVRAHAATCLTCQQLTRDLAVVLAEPPTDAEADRIGARIHGARNRTGGRAFRWLGAAGVALAAGLVWVIVMPRPADLPVPDVELARATPVPAPSVFVVDRPAIPPGEVELTVRGDAATPLSIEIQIENALDLADAGDLAGALTSLKAIVQGHQNSRLAGLALGAVQLRDNKNAEAVATLDRARLLTTDPDSGVEVDWFLSIALVRTGNRDRAKSLLDRVCQHAGARSAPACAGVAEITRAPSSR